MGSFADTTYPRKGTETLFYLCGYLCVFQTQLIPARGRKPRAFQNGWSFKRDTTYPRKGTKRAIRGHHLLRYNVKILRFVSRLRPWGGGPICLSREDIVHFPSMFGEYEMPTTGGHMGPPLRGYFNTVHERILRCFCRMYRIFV